MLRELKEKRTNSLSKDILQISDEQKKMVKPLDSN